MYFTTEHSKHTVSKTISGVEITKISDLSFGQVPKPSTCPTSFLLVHPLNSFSLIIILLGLSCSGWIVTFPSDNHPYSFTCPTPFLPVPDRRTVYDFHPCNFDNALQAGTKQSRSDFRGQGDRQGKAIISDHVIFNLHFFVLQNFLKLSKY